MRFIGDVHCRFDQYVDLITGVDESIQIGDMGIGFLKHDGTPLAGPPPFDEMKRRGNHRFIRGNNDNLRACKSQQLWIPDGHCENDMFFCGGARTVNLSKRKEGFDWWPDEELSPDELLDIHALYLDHKPGIMVTHDCPNSVAEYILIANGKEKSPNPPRTRLAFQAMWELHKPKIWIFGHWHLSLDQVIGGTRFICLAELEYIDI